LKVKVDAIGDEPINLQEIVPAQKWDIDGSDIRFSGDIEVDVQFQLCGTEILVTAHVKTAREADCARCLQVVSDKVETTFQDSYNVAELGEDLEVDSDIREHILLNFPMRVLCSKDCKGMCSGCGVNLNNERCRCAKKEEFVNKINLKENKHGTSKKKTL
jgi:uncharacterized protein